MTPTHTQQLLTKLRELIIDKPPYISGTLQLPDSYFSLFYKMTKDGNAARFGPFYSQVTSSLLTFLSGTSTLPMLLMMSWNNLRRPVNRLLLVIARLE
jgi:hypothetical protein